MAYDNTTTITGNLTRDPELKFLPNGTPVANFGIAWNKKGFDGREDESHFFDVEAWDKLGENAAETLTKGMRVTVHGSLQYQSWETPEGDKRNKIRIRAEEIAPSLKWATAKVERQASEGGGSGGGSSTPAARKPMADEDPFRIDAGEWSPDAWGEYPSSI